MSRIAKLFLALTLTFVSATPSAAQARGGVAAAPPAVAYATDGILYLASESGQVVQRIEVELPIGNFTISPDLKTVVFSIPHPGEVGGPLFILDVASGGIEPMMLDPYFNDDSVSEPAAFYSDPEFSPDGKQVVFATHAYGEGSDVQMSGPLAILDLATRKVSILKSTVGADGLPLGLVREPHWSPDGKQVLGNVEGHVFVTDAGGQVLAEVLVPQSELSQSPDSYGVYSIGWLGASCVFYQVGDQPARDPLRVLRMSTRGTSAAAAMLRLPEESLRGVRGLSGRLRMFADPEGYRVEGPGGNWLIRGEAEIAFAHLLPQRGGDGLIPADCR